MNQPLLDRAVANDVSDCYHSSRADEEQDCVYDVEMDKPTPNRCRCCEECRRACGANV